MSNLPKIEDVLAEPATLDDVLATLARLAADRKANPDEWENPTLDRYLAAMEAWLRSFRGRTGDAPTWRVVITALEAAKFYE